MIVEIDWNSLISAVIGVAGALGAVWFSNWIQRKGERAKAEEAIKSKYENLMAEVDKNHRWMLRVKEALETRFMGIFMGGLNFNPVPGSSSVVYREIASKLLEICDNNIHKVHEITTVYEIIELIAKYFKSAEDRHYQREQFFWIEDGITETIRRQRHETINDSDRADQSIIRHEEWRIQFFTSELRDYYLRLRVAIETSEVLLEKRSFIPLSEKDKNAICSAAIDRLIALRDEAVRDHQREGNQTAAEIILKSAPLEQHTFGARKKEN